MRRLQKIASGQLTVSARPDTVLQRIGEVNAVVIDPASELAVVLRYDPETMNVPIVVEKADGHSEIQGLTKQGLPIVESELLARNLFDYCNIGQEIPDDLYSDVGEMLVGVYLLHEIADELMRGLDSQSSYARTHGRQRSRSARSRLRVALD